MSSDSSRTPLNVGLVGYGLGGRAFHAPFIDTTPGMRLGAVMTSDPERRRAVEERYPAVRIVTDLDAMLALTPSLDLIAISTPNGTHTPLARAVLRAGRHVVVDKPFAATASEARETARIATDADRLAIPFQNRRWDGDFLTLQRLLRDDALGEVHQFESRFDRWRPAPKAGWCRTDGLEAAEDIVHDLGAHLIDQALLLFGPVASVYAELNRLHPDVVTCDDAFLALTHVNGVRSQLHMTCMAGVPSPRISVFGSRATYVKHGLDVQEDLLRAGVRPDATDFGEEAPEHWGTLGAGSTTERVRTERGVYWRFYAGVVAAIRDGAAPPVTIEEVARGLDVMEAAFRSAQDGVVVKIGELVNW